MNQSHLIAKFGTSSKHKLIVFGGIHGNETGGVDAIESIIKKLPAVLQNEAGSLYFIKGNISALKLGERFLDKDLNRLWQDKYILSKDPIYRDQKELKELHQVIAEDICQGKYEDCTLLDLHTFSAQSGIFCIPSGNQKSLDMATTFGVPFIEKLSDLLPGTALEYFGKKGMTSVVFEGGTHNTKAAAKNLEAAIWHSLAYTYFVSSELPVVQESRNLLRRISTQYPHHLELIYRHKLNNYNKFKMNKGYYNFKKIAKQEFLAYQDQKQILSPANGYMLMPLYQKKGSDGFFIVQEKS